MIDSRLVFFNNATITGNINSPVIEIPNFAQLQNANPLYCVINYSNGLLTSRTYQLFIEQSALITFSIVGMTASITISSGSTFFNESHFNKDIYIAKIPVHFRYLRARFLVSGITPRSLTVSKCYLTV